MGRPNTFAVRDCGCAASGSILGCTGVRTRKYKVLRLFSLQKRETLLAGESCHGLNRPARGVGQRKYQRSGRQTFCASSDSRRPFENNIHAFLQHRGSNSSSRRRHQMCCSAVCALYMCCSFVRMVKMIPPTCQDNLRKFLAFCIEYDLSRWTCVVPDGVATDLSLGPHVPLFGFTNSAQKLAINWGRQAKFCFPKLQTYSSLTKGPVAFDFVPFSSTTAAHSRSCCAVKVLLFHATTNNDSLVISRN